MSDKYLFGFGKKTTEPLDSEELVGGTGAAPDYNFTWGNMVLWIKNKLFGAATVWTSDNDGVGSGLDADTLQNETPATLRDRSTHTGDAPAVNVSIDTNPLTDKTITNVQLLAQKVDSNPADYIPQGEIDVAADFPELGTVQPGWLYVITSNVTDNDPTKTNTGQSFLAGVSIVWAADGSWLDLGSNYVTQDQIDKLNLGANFIKTIDLSDPVIGNPFNGAIVVPTEDGTYANFNNLIRGSELCIFVYESGEWIKKTITDDNHKTFIGTLKPNVELANHRNLLSDVIVDMKVSGGIEGKIYMLKTIAFNHVTLKDFTSFIEGTYDEASETTTEERQIITYSGETNPDIPISLTGKAYSKYDLGDGIFIEIWYDFDKIINWTTDLFALAGDPLDVAYNNYINRRKYSNHVNRDWIRTNFNGSPYAGAFNEASTSAASAKQFLNNLVFDVRITGAQEGDVFQFFSVAFKHSTLKDYIRFQKGHVDSITGLPIWTSNQTLFSGQDNPQYPSVFEGKHRIYYELDNNVKIEVWYDFDKVSVGSDFIYAIANDSNAYAYEAYFSKAKMVPVFNVEILNPYPTFTDKKFLIFGDSITDENLPYSWVPKARVALGNPTMVNYADGGAAFRQRSLVGIDDMPSQLINSASETDVDAVIVALGTNEYHNAHPTPPADNNNPIVGSYDASMGRTIAQVTANVNTLGVDAEMYDAIRYAFHTIQDRWNCPCYIVMPIQRAAWNYQHVEVLYTALEEMSIQYGFETIDTRRCGIVTDFEIVGGSGRDLIDGLHPEDDAAKGKIARMIVSAIRNSFTDV